MDVVATIGVDAHGQVHVAAAVDPQGRVIAERAITASTEQLGKFVEWVQSWPGKRQVAIEGAKRLRGGHLPSSSWPSAKP